MKKVLLTIDVEQDCPSRLSTVYGVEQAMPRLLDLFASEKIVVTFFTTGKIAEQFPELMLRIVNEGHELGCHGHTHRRFDQMSYKEAESEIENATRVLRQYTPVTSFRAPNLSFPDAYLPLLTTHGFQIDSSLGRYKKAYREKIKNFSIVQRVVVSLPGYCFRLPLFLSTPWIKNLDEVVLLMHPWEFIDMSKTKIRFSSRFNTGEYALNGLRKWIFYLKEKNYQFLTMKDKVTKR